MKTILLGCLLVALILNGNDCLPTELGPAKIAGPNGPPLASHEPSSPPSEPQPPSIEDGDALEDLKLSAPASPPLSLSPQPPAAPDPHLWELFNKNPEGFAAAFSQHQMQQEKPLVREARAPPTVRRGYDQFITAAVIAGLDLQRSLYTMFAPSDAFLRSNNISLPVMALKESDCLRKIVRSHVVFGRALLADGVEDVALSLEETPVFFNAKEANGVHVVKKNGEADYGIVHIINGLMDLPRLIDACPSLRHKLQTTEGRADEPSVAASVQHSISLRKVSDEDVYLTGDDSSIKSNDLNSGIIADVQLDGDVPLVEPLYDPADYPSSETNVPLELLVNIDNFAHAVKLTWQTEDDGGIIAVLQNLGASTLLALLERANMMDAIAGSGPWTIFAPDNAAWQALPPDTFDHIMKDTVLLEQILSYHIVQSNITRRGFKNNQKLESLYTGHPVHINLYSDGWASWYTASGSMITNLDEMASNGVVHVVRSVLLPPLGDLYSTVKWTPALQTAFTMLESTIEPDFSNSSLALTAFLPADSPLLHDGVAGLPPSVLSDILKRHVVRGVWFVSGLVDDDRLFTFGGDVLNVGRDGSCVGVNGTCIAVRDITLTNGVLHVIDKLI